MVFPLYFKNTNNMPCLQHTDSYKNHYHTLFIGTKLKLSFNEQGLKLCFIKGQSVMTHFLKTKPLLLLLLFFTAITQIMMKTMSSLKETSDLWVI